MKLMKYALNINGEWQNLTKTDNKRNLFEKKIHDINPPQCTLLDAHMAFV